MQAHSRHNDKTHCLRCFESFGSRGETKAETQKYLEARDEHDCFLRDLSQLVLQDSPQGRAAALQLENYVPLFPTPAENPIESKPSDKQIQLVAEALCDPMAGITGNKLCRKGRYS